MRRGVTIAGWLSALCCVCGLGGCQGEPPRELRLELPQVISSKEPVVVQARAVEQDGTVRQPSGELDFRVTPPELVTLGKRGVLRCNRSGDGSVSLRLSGLEGRAKFSCRLASRLEVPQRLSIDMAAGEVDARVKVLDAGGKELDLPVSITSDHGNVVQVRSGRLVPASVGKAKLTVRVGQLTQQMQVEVVRSLRPEVVPVEQNRRLHYSLGAGKYRLSITLPSPHKVRVDWLGAPYCAYRGEGTQHDADCTLSGKGGVTFDNPAFLRSGDKTPSIEGVTLREVP